MRKLPVIVFVMLFFSFCFYYSTKKKSEVEKIGLEDLNLQLVGVVDTVDKGENFHNFGIIRLRIISSNLQSYDPRANQKYYFCIIKNGIAEIYDHASGAEKGDTLVYDTKAKLGAVLRNGKKEDEGSITINTDESYYAYLSRKTIFR